MFVKASANGIPKKVDNICDRLKNNFRFFDYICSVWNGKF